MRIGLDTRCLYVARTGVRAYVEGLLPALPLAAPQHEFVQLCPARGPGPDASSWGKIRNHLAMLGWTELLLPLMAARRRCDVLLSFDYAAPLVAACPRVVVFHDALFWADAASYNRWWRLLQDVTTLPAARRAARVITVSQYSRQDIARHTGMPLDHIVAIHEAARPRATSSTPASDDAVLARHGLAGKPYLFHLGVLEKRKNLPALVEAVARCQDVLPEPLYLVLAGQPGPKADMDDTSAIRAAIQRCGLSERVLLPGFVPDEDVPALYRGSRAYVFPSRQEGFGIPILEAFGYGVPVAAARATALPEIAGDAAVYFAPDSVSELADALRRVLTDEGLRADLIARGRRRAALYTWERTAQSVVAVLEEAAGSRRSPKGSGAGDAPSR